MTDFKDPILVIDDDEPFRKRLARAFRDRGYETKEAANAPEALAECSESKFTFSVLDLRIGDDSGMKLLPLLKERNPDLRVVLLTGYGTIATAVESLKLGAINYLTKPVDVDAILNALHGTTSDAAQLVDAPPLAQVEWDHIQRVLSDCGGNISKASKILGLHRRSLQRKLGKDPASLK